MGKWFKAFTKLMLLLGVIGVAIGTASGAEPTLQANASKIALGHQLFFDKRLSSDGSTSCASCHDPALGWADGRFHATGMIDARGLGKIGPRNTPTALNAVYQREQFVDMRAPSLRAQATMPLANKLEMGNDTSQQVVARLARIGGYRAQFSALYGGVSEQALGDALAEFEATVITPMDAPVHRYLVGDRSALTESEERGFEIFKSINCIDCHKPPLFRDGRVHNTGVSSRVRAGKDRGRAAAPNVNEPQNERAFKTAMLIENARTAPYMHDGSLATIADVIEHYNSGGRFSAGAEIRVDPLLDPRVKPRGWSAAQKADLKEFLGRPMMSPNYPVIQAPVLPR